ncbi:phosphatidylinositol transfer protein beta isoform-like isoform X2 [Pelodiscus sinensis]|uniref:phosphatidylinositol transfer protein beta isoform-like isoform X2 n=1 Tax=Pelodiscus sinensis TaxID=13735 RepID=UPI003F6D6BCD
MKDDFFIKIETWHKPDLGTSENVHDLDPNTWKSVEVVHIDIADRTQVESADYKADEDPVLFQSMTTKRGPLGPNWKKKLAADEDCPKMCAYKLVTIKFKWWGLQNKVENFIQKQEKRIFTNFHRQLFCWIDKWIDLTMEDIRRMEDETQRELEATHSLGASAYGAAKSQLLKCKCSMFWMLTLSRAALKPIQPNCAPRPAPGSRLPRLGRLGSPPLPAHAAGCCCRHAGERGTTLCRRSL